MILLQILKWIGILLLCLLVFLLCMLILVLFLPIKYYGSGTYNQDKQYAFFKARWFWGLVRVKASYPDKPYFSVKVLWVQLLKEKAQEEKNIASRENNENNIEKNITFEEMDMDYFEEETVDSPNVSQSVSEPKEEKKEPFWTKWIGIKEDIQYYIDVLSSRETADVLAHSKERLLKILKSIKPRKLRVRGIFGFEYPDTTGYLYGLYCMISSVLGKNVILEPDFENKVIDITGSFKGRITIFVLAWNGLRIYFDKRLMRLIRKLKKGGK